ncbi:MAG: PIN domain-containing protein [Spirochaetota bacterium]
MKLLDANVVLRYLLNDVPDQAEYAASVIERETVMIPNEVLAEVVYVLSGVYGAERVDIAKSLTELLSYRTVRSPDTDAALTAFEQFASSQLDFVDCLLLGAAASGAEVITLDKSLSTALKKLAD